MFSQPTVSAPARRSETLEKLKERIRQLEAAPRTCETSLCTGVAAFDALLGEAGLPMGTVVELTGDPASGRTSLALRALASATRAGRLCAYVDCPQQLYAPLALSLGVELESVLVVRPKVAKDGPWAALQLLRSGAFACTVLDLTHSGHRISLAEGKKLTDAAAKSQSLLLLLTSPDAPGAGTARLAFSALGLQGLSVQVVRNHRGVMREALIPWDALYPHPPVWRYRQPSELPLRSVPNARVLPVPEEGKRDEVRESRDGPVGIYGQRPGRDLSMPSLAEA